MASDSSWPGRASSIAAAASMENACARSDWSSKARLAVSSNSTVAQSRCFASRASRATVANAHSARPFESSDPTSSHQLRSKRMKLR